MCQRKCLANLCLFFAFLASLLFLQSSAEKRITYYGDQVLQVLPKTQEDVTFLANLSRDNSFKLDFWTEPSRPDRPVDIHVRRNRRYRFKQLLKNETISFRVKIRNLQRSINGERMRFRSAVPFNAAFHTYSEIVNEMERLEQTNESLAKVFTLGQSYENTTIYGIKITSNVTSSNKPVFFMNCGIHAREWISISTCTYIMRELVLNYNQDKAVTHLVDTLEWIIVPVVNVDGYQYTHTTERLWRKNRRPNKNSKCVGTDLNRNFNIKWATVGVEADKPCSQIFPGTHPFSEPEALYLARYMYSIRNRIKVYIDFHAYGQLLMSPWGYTTAYPPTYRANFAAMFRAAMAILKSRGTVYRFGPAAIAIYKTSGDATDWVYGTLGVTHSYGVELPPFILAPGGFILHPDNIEPVGMETFAGVKAMAEHRFEGITEKQKYSRQRNAS